MDCIRYDEVHESTQFECHPLFDRLVTVNDRAFPVEAAELWSELPGDVTASQSLAAFRRQLKSFLFRLSYPAL